MAKGISGVSVAAIAAGTLLVVSGVRDAPVLDALRDLMQGRPPQGRAPKMTLVSAGKAAKAAQRPAGKAAGSLTRPVSGTISSGFGPRGGRKHLGVDIPMPTGTPILAAQAGYVTDTGYEPLGAGNFVKIRHENGWVTKYFHMSRILTTRGANVNAGTTIGLVGSTGRSSGPHLHFELWIDGSAVDPSGYI